MQVAGQAVGERHEVYSWMSAPRGWEHGAARDVEVFHTVYSTMGVHNPCVGSGAHPRGPHVMKACSIHEHFVRGEVEAESPASGSTEFLSH